LLWLSPLVPRRGHVAPGCDQALDAIWRCVVLLGYVILRRQLLDTILEKFDNFYTLWKLFGYFKESVGYCHVRKLRCL